MAAIEIQLIADIAGATKQISEFTKGAEKELVSLGKTTESVFTGISSAVTGAIGIAAAALGGLSFSHLVGAGAEAQGAIERLQGALKLAGQSTEVGKYEELATKIKDLIGVDDEYVLSQITLLKNLGKTDAQINKIITTAADLSSVFGQDLGTSVNELTQTFAGVAPRGLSKFVTGLRGLSEEQLKAGVGISLISAKFKGFASEVQGSATVQLKVLKENLANIVETIGKLIVTNPIFAATLQTINGILVSINDTIATGGIKLIADYFIRAAAAAATLSTIAFLPTVINAISSAVKVFTLNLSIASARGVSGFSAIASALGATEIALIAARIAAVAFKAALTLGITLLVDFLVTAAQKTKDLGDFFSYVGLSIKKAFIGGILVFTELSGKIGDFFDKFTGISKEAKDQEKVLRKTYGDELQKNLIDIDKQLSEIEQRNLEEPVKKLSKQTKTATQNTEELQAALKKAAEEAKKRFTDLTNLDFFQILKTGKILGLSIDFQNPKDLAALGVGVFKEVSKGATGASELLSKGLSLAIESVLPGLGQIAGELFNIFSQGPEKVRQFITDFFNAIPALISNLILGIAAGLGQILSSLADLPGQIADTLTSLFERLPQIIDDIINRLPEIIIKLAEGLGRLVEVLATKMPEVAQRLSTELALRAPFIAAEFVTSLVKEAPRFITELIKSLTDQITSVGGLFGGGGGGGILGGIGDSISGAIGSIGDIFGFASGGLIQGGPPFIDRIPALVQPGEFITDRSLTSDLQSFLASQKSTTVTEDKAVQQTQASTATTLVVNLQVGQSQLAQAILDLNRAGFRTAV